MEENEVTTTPSEENENAGATTETDDFLGGLFDETAPSKESGEQNDEAKPDSENDADGDTETADNEHPAADEENKAGEQEKTEPVYAKFGGQEIPIDRAAAETIASALGMSVDDYITTMQKGMNYDLLPESKAIKILDQYAEDSGMNRTQYLQFLEQNREQNALSAEIEAVRERYPDMPEDAVLELAQARFTSRQREIQSAQEQQSLLQTEQQRKEQEEARKPWLSYIQQHPEIKSPKDIPQAVIEGVQNGLSPLEAHMKMELEQLRQQMESEKKNKENRQKTPGSMKGVGNVEKDAFLSGLFGK